MNDIAIDARMRGELPKAIRCQADAAAAFERLGNWHGLVNALRHLAQFQVQSGDLKRARKTAQRAVNGIRSQVHVREQVSARCTFANILYQMGETTQARREFELAERDQASSDESEATYLHRLNGIRYCELLLDDGKFDEVIWRITQVSKTRHNQNIKALAKPLNGLLYGRALMQRGRKDDLKTADKKIATAVERLRDLGDQTYRPDSLLVMAELQYKLGRTSKASKLANEALEIAQQYKVRRADADARLARIRLLADRRKWKRTKSELAELEEIVQHMGYFRLRPHIDILHKQIPH